MDNDVARGGYDKVHHCWANKSHTVILLDMVGGPDSNVTLHYLCRAVASSSGEENDGPKSGGHQEEFRSIL